MSNTETPVPTTFGGGEIDLRGVAALVLRRRWYVIGAVLLSLAVGLLATIRAPKIYRATTRILIDSHPPRVLADEVREVYNLGSQGYWASQEYYQTQYRIIRSRPVSERVARALGINGSAIAAKIEALPEPDLQERVAREPLKTLPEALREKVTLLGMGDTASRAELVAALETFDAAAFIRSRVEVDPVKDTQLVDISVTDTDPQRAALIANAVAVAYESFNLETKTTATGSAADWLRDKELELTETVRQSELALYQFKKDNNIISVSLEDRQSMISQRLTHLSASLSDIHAERLQIESRRAQVERAKRKGLPLDVLGPVMENGLVQQLKSTAATLRQELMDLQERYTDVHPRVRATRSRLETVNREIDAEIDKQIVGIKEEYDTLRDTERRLKQEIEIVKGEALELNKKEIDYRRLVREAEKNREVYSQLLGRQKETDLSLGLRFNNVSQQEKAIPPTAPISPRPRINITLAALFGLIVGLGVSFLIDYLDNSIKTQEQVERFLRLPFLGILPSIKVSSGDREEPAERDHYVLVNPRSSIAECSRTIRTNLLFISPDDPPRTLLITSAGPREGKSTVAVNLAITMAQSGKRAVIVDTDMRRPRLHRSFGVDNSRGLSGVILGESTLDEALRSSEVEGLTLLACGPVPPNPAELLHTESFQDVLRGLRDRFDRVIFDSPPAGALSDAMILGSMVDGVVLVVQAGKTSWQQAVQTRKRLDDVGSMVFGVVLNNVNLDDKRGGGYYQYYYYRYGDEYGDDDKPKVVNG